MAKGDDKRTRNKIDYEGGKAQDYINNLREGTLMPQNQTFWNNYLSSVDQAKGDYGSLMSGYNKFATTGGFEPGDVEAIRARAIAPTRAIYANANREVDRQRSLQGGYSPGYGTLKARMAREQSQGISDANLNAEAAIAQMTQQGKLAGLSGGSSLYGATPGMANMFGGQALSSTNQRIAGEQLQNNLSLGLIDAQQKASQIPGKWENTMGRIQDVVGLGRDVASFAYPWLNSLGPQSGQYSGNIPEPIYAPPSTRGSGAATARPY